MIGWTLLFGLLSIIAIAAVLAGLPRPDPAAVLSSLIFVLLLLANLLARVLRSRA